MPEEREVTPAIYRSPGGHRYTYPIDYSLLKDLVHKILTVVEATGMNSQQTKAVKSLLNQAVYGWFEYVQENAKTAAPGSGWLPMRVLDEGVDDIGEGRRPNFRWLKHQDERGLVVSLYGGDGQKADMVAEISHTDDDDFVKVKWLGPTDETGRPTRAQIAGVWNAIQHSLTSASPYFPPEPDDDETIESVIIYDSWDHSGA